jgi:hypothetical protein
MAEGGIPAEALISLRRRLEAMPPRSADRKGLIAGAAAQRSRPTAQDPAL